VLMGHLSEKLLLHYIAFRQPSSTSSLSSALTHLSPAPNAQVRPEKQQIMTTESLLVLQ
jgi:hypothetical protein